MPERILRESHYGTNQNPLLARKRFCHFLPATSSKARTSLPSPSGEPARTSFGRRMELRGLPRTGGRGACPSPICHCYRWASVATPWWAVISTASRIAGKCRIQTTRCALKSTPFTVPPMGSVRPGPPSSDGGTVVIVISAWICLRPLARSIAKRPKNKRRHQHCCNGYSLYLHKQFLFSSYLSSNSPRPADGVPVLRRCTR